MKLYTNNNGDDTDIFTKLITNISNILITKDETGKKGPLK